MKVFFLIFFFSLNVFPQAASHRSGGASGEGCVELNSSWTPGWSSLLGYWKLNGRMSTAIAGGAAIPAMVGNAGTAVNTNGTGFNYVQGILDQGIKGDGTDDGVKVGSTTLTTGDYTISLWLKPGSNGTVFMRGDANTCSYYPNISYVSGNIVVTGAGCSGTGNFVTAAATLGTWVYVVITKSGTTGTLYLNGTSVGSGTTPNVVSSAQTVIGAAYHSGSSSTIAGSTTSTLDDVALWDVALTPSQVTTLWNNQRCR